MALRVARCHDLVLVADLDRRTFPEDDPVRLDCAWWVAWEGSTPVAFAGCRLDEWNWAYFERCGVLEKYRGQRIQARLIRARLNWAKKQGAVGAYTYTIPDRAHSGNNLIRAGFTLYRPESLWAGVSCCYWRQRF
jgi:GNAT superfamily N-acetyltransferase